MEPAFSGKAFSKLSVDSLKGSLTLEFNDTVDILPSSPLSETGRILAEITPPTSALLIKYIGLFSRKIGFPFRNHVIIVFPSISSGLGSKKSYWTFNSLPIIGFPIILLIGLTFFFMSEGIPAWIQNLSSKSSTIWNFGIVSMSAMTIIIYLSKR